MLTAASHVGRLIELRLSGTPTLEDAERFERDAHACITRAVRQMKRAVIVCSDLRATHLFRPEVTDRLIHTMRGANPDLERNGMLGNGSALLTLQLARFIKEASGPDDRRRIFTQTAQLLDFLDELLTEAERARVRRFLAELETKGLPATEDLPASLSREPSVRARKNSPGNRPRTS